MKAGRQDDSAARTRAALLDAIMLPCSATRFPAADLGQC
jgi:hypothetical protein